MHPTVSERNPKPELHLFIVWSKAIPLLDAIVADMRHRFDILDAYLVCWSQSLFSFNLSRFYGTRLPDGSFKEKHCGRDPFCLIIVRDHQPRYEERQTSVGIETVNVNLFDAKQHYRNLAGGGHRIHATNTPEETDHDLMLLLETDSQQFIAEHPLAWDGRLKTVKRELAGARGWASLTQLFHVLNATTPYVVLRNFEGLPTTLPPPEHPDIDLLCANLSNIRFIANAEPVFKEKHRVLYRVAVDNQKILFDFRHIGDGYYHRQWQTDLIAQRILSEKGFYRPNPEGYFHSLLYHALVHKPKLREDYRERLALLARDAFIAGHLDFRSSASLNRYLNAYLRRKGYAYTEPKDLSVFFNAVQAPEVALSWSRLRSTSPSMEDALTRLFNQTPDCSSGSMHLQSADLVGRSELRPHLSFRRHAFLSAVEIEKCRSVLEIGAGSGAVTRFLGESCERVVAVEESKPAAEAVRARCRDLKTVSIVGSLKEVAPVEAGFDLILFTCDCSRYCREAQGLKRIAHLIKTSVCWLSPQGAYLFCFTNSLGTSDSSSAAQMLRLKSNGPTELSGFRADEVVDFFHRIGLDRTDVIYFYPNHLLPDVMLSAEAAARCIKGIGYWAASGCRDVAGLDLVHAGELALAGHIGDAAGGIAVMAAHPTGHLPQRDWQVMAFSSVSRPLSTQTRTRLLRGDTLRVVKEGKPRENELFAFRPNMHMEFVDGELADTALLTAVKTGDIDYFIHILVRIASYWKSNFSWKQSPILSMPALIASDDEDLDGKALEALPRNMMLVKNSMQVFDLEWYARIPLPLSYLLFRSIRCLDSLIAPQRIIDLVGDSRLARVENFNQAIMALIERTGLVSKLNPEAAAFFHQFDARFLAFAFGKECEQPSLLELYQLSKKEIAGGNQPAAEIAITRLNHVYGRRPEVECLMAFWCSRAKPDRTAARSSTPPENRMALRSFGAAVQQN